MKKNYFLFAALALALLAQITSAQMVEKYKPNHLGRIAEISTPDGLLPQYHTLVGYDSTYT